jgi:hypothetical protein
MNKISPELYNTIMKILMEQDGNAESDIDAEIKKRREEKNKTKAENRKKAWEKEQEENRKWWSDPANREKAIQWEVDNPKPTSKNMDSAEVFWNQRRKEAGIADRPKDEYIDILSVLNPKTEEQPKPQPGKNPESSKFFPGSKRPNPKIQPSSTEPQLEPGRGVQPKPQPVPQRQPASEPQLEPGRGVQPKPQPKPTPKPGSEPQQKSVPLSTPPHKLRPEPDSEQQPSLGFGSTTEPTQRPTKPKDKKNNFASLYMSKIQSNLFKI